MDRYFKSKSKYLNTNRGCRRDTTRVFSFKFTEVEIYSFFKLSDAFEEHAGGSRAGGLVGWIFCSEFLKIRWFLHSGPVTIEQEVCWDASAPFVNEAQCDSFAVFLFQISSVPVGVSWRQEKGSRGWRGRGGVGG